MCSLSSKHTITYNRCDNCGLPVPTQGRCPHGCTTEWVVNCHHLDCDATHPDVEDVTTDSLGTTTTTFIDGSTFTIGDSGW